MDRLRTVKPSPRDKGRLSNAGLDPSGPLGSGCARRLVVGAIVAWLIQVAITQPTLLSRGAGFTARRRSIPPHFMGGFTEGCERLDRRGVGGGHVAENCLNLRRQCVRTVSSSSRPAVVSDTSTALPSLEDRSRATSPSF